MNDKVKPCANEAHDFEPRVPVGIIVIDGLTAVSSCGDVVKSTGKF
jgi:hypothetical protein